MAFVRKAGCRIFLAAAVAATAHSAQAFTLSTGSGEGDFTVGVDLYGAFGSSVGGADTTDAFFDPVGDLPESGTVFESAVAVSFANIRAFLNSGDMFTGGVAISDAALVAAESVAGQRAVSTFTIPNLAVKLTQEVGPSVDGGVRVGGALTQTYRFTNTGDVTTNFDVVRYVDGDLDFDGTIDDGGGRIAVGANEILFETDAGEDPSASTTFVGITGTGGATQPGNRYQVSEYSDLRSNVESGLPLADFVQGDEDFDEFIDAPYDVTMALRNVFSIAPGATAVYTTQTLFGNAVPPSPGSSELLPLLPEEIIDNAFIFDTSDTPTDQTVWYDPIVTEGYDYVGTGLTFGSITAPGLATVPDADGYIVDVDGVLTALAPSGTLVFDTPVSAFSLLGINPLLGLDPDDPLAFPLGISFASNSGDSSLSIQPRTVEIGTSEIPLPGAAWAMLMGMAGLVGLRRRRRASA